MATITLMKGDLFIKQGFISILIISRLNDKRENDIIEVRKKITRNIREVKRCKRDFKTITFSNPGWFH